MVRGPKKVFPDQLRLPITTALIKAVDAAVISTGESRSAFIRAAIEEKIAAQDKTINDLLNSGADLDSITAAIEAEIEHRKKQP